MIKKLIKKTNIILLSERKPADGKQSVLNPSRIDREKP